MTIRDLMTVYPVCIPITADMRRAAEIISISEASDIMVINENRQFVGVLSEGDLLRALLPDFEEVLKAGGTLPSAFRFFVDKGRRFAPRLIEPLVIRECITVAPADPAGWAATIMVRKQIRRLPVVDEEGFLVGTVSRSDICRAVIYNAKAL
jgi:CBS domain-containing protein